MLFSPSSRDVNPPTFGRLVANSESVLAALAEAVTASGFIPTIESAYAFMPLPKGANWYPNVAILFSPANKETNPPAFGRFAANSDNYLAAFAEAVTDSGLIPATESAYAFIPLPKGANW